MAWHYGPAFARLQNNVRERHQHITLGYDYFETAADILIVDVAIEHVRQIQVPFGVSALETLPQLLIEDACGDSIEEIYDGWAWPNSTVEQWIGPPP